MSPTDTTLKNAHDLLQTNNFAAVERLSRQRLQAQPNCPDDWFLLGEALLGQRRPAEADSALRRASQMRPEAPRWLLRLGTTLAELGQTDEAASTLRQALARNPELADAHYHLGLLCYQRKQAEEAIACYREAVRCRPDHVEALTNLGVALARQGRVEEAVANLQQAVALRPTYAKAHHNLGVALAQYGQLTESAASLRRALQQQPDYAEAHFNLGNTLRELGKPTEALTSFYQALHHRPDYPDALNNLGLLLTESGRSAEALILLQQALRLRPDFTEARNNLGLALADLGRYDEAIACYEQVLTRNPLSTDAHTNLGSAYKEQGRLEEAVACYDQALRLKPEAASTHWNRALAWLQMGDYERGWVEHEWRWQRKNARPRVLPGPLWDGTPLAGRVILLWCEQGLGDAIQFVRYAPLVAARGGRVLLECPPHLRKLFESVNGVECLLVEGEPLPRFDVHAPLMSLPYLCRTTLATVPATVPYLSTDTERRERWRVRLQDGGFRVGVVWQGNPRYKWDRHRSFPLHALAPLAAVPGVQLVSLQKGPGLDQLGTEAPRFPVTLLGDDLDAEAPFVDTAAVMKQLDLVVSADTSAAHLAGALGVPTWVALSALTDWRWLRGRNDTPWYPTVRLFWQRTLGDWTDVFQHMASELKPLAGYRQPQHKVSIPVAPGELLDKLTILQIKLERLTDSGQLAQVRREHDLLAEVSATTLPPTAELAPLLQQLKAVNNALWQVEDALRHCERQQEFGYRFIRLARSVYHHNDRRAALKRQLNEILDAQFSEQKSYPAYETDTALLHMESNSSTNVNSCAELVQ